MCVLDNLPSNNLTIFEAMDAPGPVSGCCSPGQRSGLAKKIKKDCFWNREFKGSLSLIVKSNLSDFPSGIGFVAI